MLLGDVTNTFRKTKMSGVHAHERPLLKLSFRGHATADGDAGLAYWQYVAETVEPRYRGSYPRLYSSKAQGQMRQFILSLHEWKGWGNEGIRHYIGWIVTRWIETPPIYEDVTVTGTRKKGEPYVTTISLRGLPKFEEFYPYWNSISNHLAWYENR